MKLLSTLVLLAAATSSWAQGQTAPAPAPAGSDTSSISAIGPYIRLQPSSPGTTQPGNSHIAGTAMASEFVANSPSGNAVVGTGGDMGVVGSSSNPATCGVYGENYPGVGVVGRSHSVAVWGDATGTGFRPVGVFGSAILSPEGWGVLGYGATYGVVSWGDSLVQGDLIVTGSKTGYVVDVIRNGDGVPLAPGELVEIVGSEPAVLGDIPVAVVRRASAQNPRAVLGPISNALVVGTPIELPSDRGATHAGESQGFSMAEAAPTPSVQRIEGAILPGRYGNVVTMGAFRAIKVDARFGAIHAGDLLVASPTPGFAMADPDPKTGTVIGKALASWNQGQGEIPVMVGMR